MAGEVGGGGVASGGSESGEGFFLTGGTGFNVMGCFNKAVLGGTTVRVAPCLRGRRIPPPNLDSASSTNDSCILEPKVGVPHLDDERSIKSRSSVWSSLFQGS